MSSTNGLLERLRYLAKAEAAKQWEDLERRWSMPLTIRVANGWAIEGLSLDRIDKGILRFRCYTNDSRFREGDLMVLHRGNPADSYALHVELQYDAETELEFSLIRGNQFFLESQTEGWIADQDFFDPSQFYLEALNTVADSLRGRTRILPMLQGSLQSCIDIARYERAAEELGEAGLNDSQIEAVAQAYATDLVHLIQGPPGTGKTLMLAHLARMLVADGQRVFITALSHQAIHNALNKITDVDADIPICKIGQGHLVAGLRVDNYENFTESHFGDLDCGYVIGATPFALLGKRLANVEFDVILFDEASQVTLPLAIMGMLAGDKYVFVGDPNQLPPVSVFDSRADAPDSIFSYLTGRGYETMLNITYRLNDILVDWPNQTFYEGKLVSSEQAAKRRLQLSTDATVWDEVLDPQAPIVFVDTCQRNTTVRSKLEADVTVEIILALLYHGISPDEIGVVVPYRAQSRLIRSLLRKNIADEEVLKDLIVDTVERMQGQEREVVMISFATASPSFAARMSDFLLQAQRLNVAVTRPRTKLILVGSSHLLFGDQLDPPNPEGFVMFKDLLEHCRQISAPDGVL